MIETIIEKNNIEKYSCIIQTIIMFSCTIIETVLIICIGFILLAPFIIAICTIIVLFESKKNIDKCANNNLWYSVLFSSIAIFISLFVIRYLNIGIKKIICLKKNINENIDNFESDLNCQKYFVCSENIYEKWLISTTLNISTLIWNCIELYSKTHDNSCAKVNNTIVYYGLYIITPTQIIICVFITLFICYPWCAQHIYEYKNIKKNKNNNNIEISSTRNKEQLSCV